jgi:hypothetical protein
MPLGAHARAEPCTKAFFITIKYTKITKATKLTDYTATKTDFFVIEYR